jgi:ribonuclease VapC
MSSRWLLDSSALLALRDDEDGAERVAQVFQSAQDGESRCLVCFMSRMEVFYRVWKDEGERNGRLADAQL